VRRLTPDWGGTPLQILVYARDPESYLGALREAAPEHRFCAARTPEELEPCLAEVEAAFAWGLPAEALGRMPRLRWLQWLGAGVDQVVGRVPEGVQLTRIVGAFSAVMAEHVFAYVLALRRGVFEMRLLQDRGEWRKVFGRPLRDARLGVAGLGAIGAEVARLGRAFGMEVWGLSRTPKGTDVCDRHFAPQEMAEFAAGVDALVLVLPKTPATDGVVDARVLAGMRPGSILVNIGRGNAVVEEDLAAALQRGRPAAAQLDVFAREPLPADSPLWRLPNCYISAHCSGPSAPELVQDFARRNLRRFLDGEPLLGVVDAERGY